jgi:isoquinoline 1-oxidoreductase beta subunit
MNCTVQLKPGTPARSGSAPRIMTRVQGTVAKLTGLPLDKVIVHNHYLGGGFGRRLEPDMA